MRTPVTSPPARAFICLIAIFLLVVSKPMVAQGIDVFTENRICDCPTLLWPNMKEKCIIDIGNTDVHRGNLWWWVAPETGVESSGTNHRTAMCLCPYFARTKFGAFWHRFRVWIYLGRRSNMIVGHPSFCVAVSFIFVVGLQFLIWSVYICMADVFHATEKEQRSVVVW